MKRGIWLSNKCSMAGFDHEDDSGESGLGAAGLISLNIRASWRAISSCFWKSLGEAVMDGLSAGGTLLQLAGETPALLSGAISRNR